MKNKISIVITIIGIVSILVGITIIVVNSNGTNNKKNNKETMSEIETYELMMEQLYYKEGTNIKYKETTDDGNYVFERYKDGELIESYKVSKDGKTVINSQNSEDVVGG